MKKLGINTAAGVLEIITCVFFLGAFKSLFDIPYNGGAATFKIVDNIFLSIICIILHTYGIIKSMEVNINTSGHIMGIVGNVVFNIGHPLFMYIGFVLTLLSSIFVLTDNKVPLQFQNIQNNRFQGNQNNQNKWYQ